MSTIDINQLLGSIQNGSNPTNNNDDSDNQLLTMLLELLNQLVNNQNNGEQSPANTNNYFDNNTTFSQSNTSNIYKLIIDTSTIKSNNPNMSSFEIKNARLHDVDGDNYLNNNDLAMMKDYVKGKFNFTKEQIQAGDFDNNGEVDNTDIYILTERLKPRADGDVNGDGKVNKKDLEIAEDFTFREYGYTNNLEASLTSAEINAIQNANLAFYSKTNLFFDNSALYGLKRLTQDREKGDVNNDGQINQADLDMLNKLTIFSDETINAADFDGDGSYDKDKDPPLLKELVDKNNKPVKNPNKKTKTKKTKKKH